MLPQRATSGIAKLKTYLIREFATAPLVDDWEAILAENRAAFLCGRTW